LRAQFEDFNSADAFPILSAHRNDYLCFNDDVQGTAAAVVAGILGSLRLQNPCAPELVPLLREHTFLFHGAGSANLGTAILLVTIAGVPRERIYLTNSKGLVWTEPTAAGAPTTGGSGTARNDGQRAFARVGAPGWPCVELADIVRAVRPSFLIGATGVSPGCFDRTVVDTLVAVQARARSVCGIV
jgi:malic enzyme